MGWTRRSRSIPPIYIIVVFFVIPLLLLGLSELFTQDSVGYTVLGSFLVVLVAVGTARLVWFWKKQDGKEKFIAFLDRRQVMSATRKTLPEDMTYLKAKVEQLAEHTGLPEEDEEFGAAQQAVEKELSAGTAEDDVAEVPAETTTTSEPAEKTE